MKAVEMAIVAVMGALYEVEERMSSDESYKLIQDRESLADALARLEEVSHD